MALLESSFHDYHYAIVDIHRSWGREALVFLIFVKYIAHEALHAESVLDAKNNRLAMGSHNIWGF